MLRVALHVVLGSSLLAGPAPEPAPAPAPEPASGREYAGEEAVAVESAPATDASEPAPESPPPAPAEPEPEAVAEGPIEDETDADEPPYNPLVDSPEAIRARSWVRSGAVFLTVGAVLAGGAIAMATAPVNTETDQTACNPRQDHAGNGCLAEARQRAVAAMATPGALLLAGGVAMLTTGLVQQRRLRASLRASRREVMIGVQFAF